MDAAAAVAAQVSALCREAVDAGCEGLMVKSLDGPTSLYAPAKRCETAWIKLKKDYLADGLADTIDVVPIAAWHGSGRKAGWLSPYLCAVYNEETEEYEGLCKVMTGFTDKEFEQFSAEFRSKALPRSDGRGRSAERGDGARCSRLPGPLRPRSARAPRPGAHRALRSAAECCPVLRQRRE